MNPSTIDIIFLGFILLMIIFGYLKGFVTRLYDFITTILILYISYFFAEPLNTIIKIYDYNQQDPITAMAGDIINQIIVFVILFIGLFIAKKIIDLFIKPLLKAIIDKFSLTKFTDRLLGVGLSFVEAILISYISVLIVMSPVFPEGKELINQTVIAKEVVRIMPAFTSEVQQLSNGLAELSQSHSSTENIVKVMLTAYDMGLIDDEQVNNLIKENITAELTKKDITLSKKDYKLFEDLLLNLGYNDDEIYNILNNVSVSDE